MTNVDGVYSEPTAHSLPAVHVANGLGMARDGCAVTAHRSVNEKH